MKFSFVASHLILLLLLLHGNVGHSKSKQRSKRHKNSDLSMWIDENQVRRFSGKESRFHSFMHLEIILQRICRLSNGNPNYSGRKRPAVHTRPEF